MCVAVSFKSHAYSLLQANGLVERFNQTLQHMLLKFISDKKETWEDYLDTCVFAYNTSKHESSKFTPFEVMFGRQAVLPVDLHGDSNADSPPAEMKEFNDAALEEMMVKKTAQLATVKENILAAQAKQKEAYDKKHSAPEVYRVGALVLKKDFLRKKRKGGKLDHKLLGPYTITHSLGRGLYALQEVANPRKVVTRVNGVHLKMYIQPPEQVYAY